MLFFSKVTRIEQNAFAIPYTNGNFGLQSLYLPGCLTFLDSGAFTNHKSLSQIQIGSTSSPSQLASIGDGPFRACGTNASSLTITYYYSGSPYTDSM